MPLLDLVSRLEKQQLQYLQKHSPKGLEGVNPSHWPEPVFLQSLCDVMGIPTYSVTADNVDLDSYGRLINICTKHRFVPLYQKDMLISVACLEPWNKTYISALRKIIRKEVRPVGVTESELMDVMANLDSRLARLRASKPPAPPESLTAPFVAWDLHADDSSPYIRMVGDIIDAAHKIGASDIHLEPEANDLQVRFRVNNEMDVMPPIEVDLREKIVEAFKIKSNIPADEVGDIRRGRIDTITSIGRLDLRVEVCPNQHGDKVTCRLLDPRSLERFYGKLPFEGEQLKAVQRSIETYRGIILVTGPTGSGKSTTLLGSITSLDIAGMNISTIEDPIEYSLAFINQIDIARSRGKLTFAKVLRSLLRQDPDVILVGEIRDVATMRTAIEGAQTGHLLFSTLHTNSAPETIKRILDMEEEGTRVDPGSLAATLNCVIAQRLVERLCPACKETIPVPPSVRRWYKAYKLPVPETIKTKRGCNCCRGGVKGRLPVFEVLEMTENLRNRIHAKFDPLEFEQAWLEEGGVTLAVYALGLVAAGEVDYREARALIWKEEALADRPEA